MPIVKPQADATRRLFGKFVTRAMSRFVSWLAGGHAVASASSPPIQSTIAPPSEWMDAALTVTELRGLEGVSFAPFDAALRRGDRPELAFWYARTLETMARSEVNAQVLLAADFLLQTLREPVATRAHESSVGSERPSSLAPSSRNPSAASVSVARALAAAAVQEQMHFRSELAESLGPSAMVFARKKLYLLQMMIFEALAWAHQLEPASPTLLNFAGQELTEPERTGAGIVLKIEVIPGDVIIQLSSHALSSEFIAHSQTDPGVASHSALIVETGERVLKMEALIEDGVNLREMKNSVTEGETVQMWILSLKTPAERRRAGQATQAFAMLHRLPTVGPGLPEAVSPLKYDATMNPDMVSQGAYYCTTLLEKIYSDTGLGPQKIPFRPDESNWTRLKGLEAEVYRTLSIIRTKIAAPSDAFLNPDFEIRGTTVNVAVIAEARRLHATVDAFFFLIAADHEMRKALLHELISLPDLNLDKRKTLAILDRALELGRESRLVSANDLARVRSVREKIYEALPQHATLRQVVFFFYLNHILQARMLESLAQFESGCHNQMASALELRQRAVELLGDELDRASGVLKIVNRLVPGGTAPVE